MAKNWTRLALVGLLRSFGRMGRLGRGVAAFKAKNYAQAVREFEGVVGERPDWPQGHLMLGKALLGANRTAQGVEARARRTISRPRIPASSSPWRRRS